MSNLAEQLDQVPFFPPGIHVFPRLMPLLSNDRYPTDELAEVVRVDTGLTADILRVCNSVAFGYQVRAQTVQEAILRLGLREVYTITSKVIAAPILGGDSQNIIEGVDLWHHSLATASAAAVLAKEMRWDPELAFTVGLLHDIGKVRLVQTLGKEYGKAILTAREGLEQLHTLEARHWGIDHAVIGGQLFKSWSFPFNMRDAVLLHHTVAGSTPNLEFAALINVADYLAGSVGFGYDRMSPLYPPHPRALQLMNLGLDQLEALRQPVWEHYTREQAPLLEG